MSKQFPILMHPTDWRKYPDCPKTIPWNILEPYENQALKNHTQSLKILAERGGLDPIEVMAIIEGKSIFDYDDCDNYDKNLFKAVMFVKNLVKK